LNVQKHEELQHVNAAECRRRFRQAYGRSPIDEYELTCGMFRQSWTANPASWDRAQRTVAYAEAQGGEVLTFARMHWPHYWGLEMPVSLSSTIEELGISEDRAKQLLQQIGEACRGAQERSLTG
jgi:hypothetical protein